MIFTFYSYKGGVGRSMALANVAQYLCQLDFKVLVVDWDLESPGIHRFFNFSDIDLNTPGVIDLLIDYKQKMVEGIPQVTQAEALPFLKPRECAVHISTEVGNLSLLPAGSEIGQNFVTYAKKVHQFDWDDFYKNWEGARYFSWLRQQFLDTWDFILIDSRTGVSEMGGVSTYQLADTIVMFCAPNRQNIDGVNRMAKNFTHEQVREARGGRALHLVITPSRVERAESYLLDQFQIEFTERFWPFMKQNAKGIFEKNEMWHLLNIPYVAKYAFSEMIAMQEELGKLSAIDMQAAYTNLTAVSLKLSLPHTDAKLQKFLQNQSSIPSEEKTFFDLAKGNGFGYDRLDVKCIIANDGSATIKRQIKATAFREISYLQTYLLITGEEVGVDIDTGPLKSLTPNREVFLRNQKEEYSRLTAQIFIDPPLYYGDAIEYVLEETLSSELFAIGKSYEEISSRKSPDDFFNWNISNPTRKLILEVHFPLDSQPQHYKTEVGFSTTNELDRLSDPIWQGNVNSKAILRLTVDYPKVGLTYGIRWQPLASD